MHIFCKWKDVSKKIIEDDRKILPHGYSYKFKPFLVTRKCKHCGKIKKIKRYL